MSMQERTVDQIRRIISRKPIPPGQITLYKVLYEAYPGSISHTELAHQIRADDTKSLTGVIGALGNRVNQTPGLEQDKPGVPYLIEKLEGEGLVYRMSQEMHDAIRAIPELHAEFNLTADEIFKKFANKQNWLRVTCSIDVEVADLSDDELRAEIEAGRLHFGMVETSTAIGDTRRRRGQAQLRQLTLKNYRFRCALCDVEDPDLLIASHVIGWAERADTRGDLKNTICLCRFHDALFETGYWSLMDDLQIIRRTGIYSSTILDLLPPTCSFSRPIVHQPAAGFLRHHRTAHGYEPCEANTRA